MYFGCCIKCKFNKCVDCFKEKVTAIRKRALCPKGHKLIPGYSGCARLTTKDFDVHCDDFCKGEV